MLALGAGALLIGVAGVKKFLIDGPDKFDPLPNTLAGRTVIITGGNTGLGKESAIRLARGGATVVFTARSAEKGKKALEEIQAAVGANASNVHFLELDLADLSSVKSFRQRFESQPYGKNLTVLMNNAGVMAIPERQVTKDGFEQQFGVNHLGHFALVAELLPLMEKSGPGRIINVSSTAHLFGTADQFDGDLMAPEKYAPWAAYGQSKLANVLFAKELDRRLRTANVPITAVSCHPGAVDTDLARWLVVNKDDAEAARKITHDTPVLQVLTKFLARNVQLGANTQVYLAAGGDGKGSYDKSGGVYFDNMAPGLLNPAASDEDLAKRLWAESERLTGIKLKI